MTTTTMEGNRIIAEFMGESHKPGEQMLGFGAHPFTWEDWMYDYDKNWNSLMPVVEKIYKLSKDWPKLTEPVWQIRIVAPIETVYQNVVDVIIAYNTSNRPDGE